MVYNIFNTVIELSHLTCHNVLYFLNNPSGIFLKQLHSISEYCRILSTPPSHHLRLCWNWLNSLIILACQAIEANRLYIDGRCLRRKNRTSCQQMTRTLTSTCVANLQILPEAVYRCVWCQYYQWICATVGTFCESKSNLYCILIIY
jgi:hypothetical protein